LYPCAAYEYRMGFIHPPDAIDRLSYLAVVNVKYVYMIEEISQVGCKKYTIWDFFYIELRRYPIKVFLFKQNKYYLTINVEIGNIY
jgi:hypothetical protein